MMIKYCPNCTGHPYTKEIEYDKCPICGTTLYGELADEKSLTNREKLFFNTNTDSDGKQIQPSLQNDADIFSEDPSINENVTLFNSSYKAKSDTKGQSSQTKVVRGKIGSYSSSGKEDGNHRRLLISKIFDAIVYNQRLEDLLHRFVVRTESGFDEFGNTNHIDVPVNVHGTIAGGMQLADNCEVEVHGKYNRNGVLLAKKIYILNNGYKTRVKFQHSISAIVYSILFIIALAVAIYYSCTESGYFLDNMKYFVITWGIIVAIMSVLYITLIMSKIGIATRIATGKPGKFPFLGILIFSFIIAAVILLLLGGISGISALLISLLKYIIPIIILIVIVVLLLKIII